MIIAREITVKKTKKIIFFTLAILFIVATFFRIGYFGHYYNNLTDETLTFTYLILKHDLALWGLLLILYVLSTLNIKPFLRYTARSIMLFFTLVYIIDLVIVLRFNTRMLAEDMFRYSSDFLIFLGPLKNSPGAIIFVLVLIPSAIFILYHLFTFKMLIKQPLQKRLLIISTIAIVFNMLLIDNHAAYSWIYQNIFEINTYRGINKSYTDQFKQKSLKEYNTQSLEKRVCTPDLQKKITKKNIIMLVLESYSNYHSDYFSGIENFTPLIDQLARENISFTQFYANSFKTEGGLIALLMGIFPIPTVDQYFIKGRGFASTLHYKESSLPKRLNRIGYQTEFLTNGNLEFGNKQEWLNNIGVTYKEGSEHPYYNQWPRFKFDAAEDRALYNRLISRIKAQKPGHPYFVVVENVSTHLPFMDPKTKINSEELVFKYEDKEVYRIYQYLLKNKFFDNGILVITSDHRATTPLRKEEINLYGEEAPSRIPMVIIDGKKRGYVVKGKFQQTDVPHSIMNMLAPEVCLSDFQGDIFLGYTPRYILHARYDDQNIVNLFTDHGNYRIELDGDETSFYQEDSSIFDLFLEDKTKALEDNILKNVINKINHERIIREIQE